MEGKSKLEALENARSYLRTWQDGRYDKIRIWSAFVLLDGMD